MKALLLLAALRFYRRHPWQLALAIAGVALGVAVHVGVSLANDSAWRAFELSSEALVGRTTHRVLPVGDALPESLYAEIVTDLGVTAAAPVVEAEVELAVKPPQRARLLGIDPVKEPIVRSLVGLVPGGADEAFDLMTVRDAVLLPDALADELGIGDLGVDGERGTIAIDARIGGRVQALRPVGTVRGGSPDAELPLVADIATVQRLADRRGSLDRIDLRLDAATAARLAAALPAGATLVPAGRDPAFEQLTTAFHTNLTALGLLALVVGMFLIYSTMAFAIVQRRAAIGTMLAIGLARRELLLGVLGEALAIGAIATVIGLAFGHWLARGLVELMLDTISDLAFAARVSAASPSPWLYVGGAALGLGATLVAALGPALDASRGKPADVMQRSALERSSRARSRVAALAAPPVLGTGALLLAAAPSSLATAFAGLFCVLLSGALATPAATAALMRVLDAPAGRAFGLPGLLAVRGVTASLSRTGVAASALAVAVATVVGIGLMIASFRASVVRWLETTLTADLYVSLEGDEPVDALVASLRELPGVEGIGLTRVARLPTRYGELVLRAVTPGPEGFGLVLVASSQDALERLAREPSIALSEPFAYRQGLELGDRLVLPTSTGERAFPIVAIYRDYNAAGSAALMSLEQYRALWNDRAISSIGVHVADRARIDEVAARLAALVPRDRGRIVSTEGVVDVSLAVFDRTFKITEVLRLLAGSIAFLGVLSSALSIELERARERAVLRAVGLGPGGLAALTLAQTTLLGAAAGLAAVPMGSVLAALLVHVINRRSFGWTMSLEPDPRPVLVGIALAVGAAFLAGIYPASRARRVELGRALREE